MSKKKHVTADEISRAREVHLIDYLEAKGESFKKEGASYYRHTEHDSLIVKDNMYYWNSRQEKGVGSVSFAMSYYNMSFPEAVVDINHGNYKKQSRDVVNNEHRSKRFQYPNYLETQDKSAAKNYLVNERKIDGRLVDWLIKNDLIAQDKKKNVIFKWKDKGGKGVIIGADRQGTIKMGNKNNSFKQIMSGGKENIGFTVDIGKPNKMVVFESPVDMLSYWSLKQQEIKDARLISMSGLKPNTVMNAQIEATKEGLDIRQWILAVDNDKAGANFIEVLKESVNGPMKTDLPNAKDWNDELKLQTQKQQQKEKSMSSNVLERGI